MPDINITAKTTAAEILFEIYLNGTLDSEDVVQAFLPHIQDDLDKHDISPYDIDYGDLELTIEGEDVILKLTGIPVEEEDE